MPVMVLAGYMLYFGRVTVTDIIYSIIVQINFLNYILPELKKNQPICNYQQK